MPTQRLTDREKLVRKALKLYNQGNTYATIAGALGITTTKAWIFCNQDRHRASCRESAQRYRARGYTALVDMP